jgi:ketosteroid isomerase-like protein
MDHTEASTTAVAYIDAVGARDSAALNALLADDLTATVGGDTFDKAAWITALERLMLAVVRNDIRHVFTDGATACVVYDFVTDTEAGAVACVEIVAVEGGRIHAIELIFERAKWSHVMDRIREVMSS